MSLCCWIVLSVTGEYGTGMKAFSWLAQATSFPPRRETTTLLVPTSMPTGWEPPLTRSSIFSGPSSGAFQRWSLFSVMWLSSACGPLPRRRGRLLRRLRVLRLLVEPEVVGPRSLPPQVVDTAARGGGVVLDLHLGLAHPGPRLAHHGEELLVVAEPEEGHGRRGPPVLVGEAEG